MPHSGVFSKLVSISAKLLSLTALFVVTGCVSNPPKTTASPSRLTSAPVHTNSTPCWINQPVREGIIGQVGTALNNDIGGRKPVTKSREYAARTLANYLGAPLSEKPLVEDHQVKSISLAGHHIYFVDDYADENGLIHSYAVLDNPISATQLRQASCQPEQCDILACSPGWLCSPGQDNKLAVLGVSYQTAKPSSQRDVAVYNALFTAQYMYGVDVAVEKHLTTVASSSQTLNILDNQSALRKSQDTGLRYLVTDQCMADNTLFARVALPGLSSSRMAVAPNDLAWMKNPKYKGFDGAVGSSEKMAASGLFSDQIKLAIKRAIVQLALEKESNISEDLLNIDYETGGSIFVSSISNRTRVNMKVKVLSMHMTSNASGVTQVYAWVGRLDD